MNDFVSTEEVEKRELSRSLQQTLLGGVFLLLVVLSIASLLYLTINWMLDEQRLPLSKVIIQGDLNYVSPRDVQLALSQMDHVGTFMSQDVNELQGSVLALPWVAQASVRKQWPDLVKIYLVEHQASAIWNGNAMLNQKGDVFNADVAQLREDRVKLYGPEGSSRNVLEIWRQISPLFEPLGLTISSLVLNDRRAWQIILDNGIRLEMGKDSLIERVDRFIALYYRLGKDVERVSYIDLRYDIGAAVGWFPEQPLLEQNLQQESTND